MASFIKRFLTRKKCRQTQLDAREVHLAKFSTYYLYQKSVVFYDEFSWFLDQKNNFKFSYKIKNVGFEPTHILIYLPLILIPYFRYNY